MNIVELKKLVEACEAAEHMMKQGHKRAQAEAYLKELVTHEAILKLLQINAELVEALKNLLNDTQHSEHFCGDPNCPVANAIAALAKAEGGEL